MSTIQIEGRIGGDIEVRATPNGKTVAEFRVAESRWTRGTDGERTKAAEPTWFTVTVWDWRAEALAGAANVGDLVAITGRLDEARPWIDRHGVQKVDLKVTAAHVGILPKRADQAPGA